MLRAYAKGKKQVDFWKLSCGGEAHAEAGIKAKFADTETIVSEFKGAIKKKLVDEDKAAFDKKYSSEESKASRLYIENGKLIADCKIGFSGLAVYSLAYAELSCSVTVSEKKPPQSFFQAQPGGTVYSTEESDTKTSGLSKKWGDAEEQVHYVIGADPLIWNPKFNLFGTDK